MSIRQPGVEGEHRHLDGEANEEDDKDPELEIRRNHAGDLMELRDEERLRVAQTTPAKKTRAVVEIESQDSQQHQHRAHQRVEKELDGGVEPARSTPNADQKVHRDQHDLPEHIEQEEVHRHENAHHAGLQQEQEDVVLLLSRLDGGPGRQESQNSEEGRQQDQQQGDTVDPELVSGTDGLDPGRTFAKLKQIPLAIKGEPKRYRDDEVDQSDQRGEGANARGVLLLHEEHHEQRAYQR